MDKDSELIIEVADEYESLKSFESGNQQMDDFIHNYLSACSLCHFCMTYYVRLKPKGDVIALFSLSCSKKLPDLFISGGNTFIPRR